jgi:hypothetical protein
LPSRDWNREIGLLQSAASNALGGVNPDGPVASRPNLHARTSPMRTLLTSCLLAPLLVPSAATADEPKGEDSWRPLFDGKTLDGWEHVGPGKMVVEDGLIRTEGGMGLLWYTKEKFGDCVLRVAYKTTHRESNAGVFVRIADKPKDPWYAVHHGYEVQICDVQDDYHGTGSVYSLSKMTSRPAKPPGEWNTMEITLKGTRIQVAINGVRVNDFDSETAKVPERRQEFEPEREPRRPTSGYIGLQNHDDYVGRPAYVEFKEVSVKKLVATAGEPVYPAKVSDNGRYFVDQRGEPIFWLGTTQWELFRGYKLEDARTIIEKSKAKGFAFAQVMLMGVGDGTKPNAYGEKPWINDDPATPNEAYFKNVDAVVRCARENNFVISMTIFHQRYRKAITLAKARAWAKWIASRYKDVPTIVWSTTPEAKPDFVPILRELAAGLREGDGGAHLITFKPDPAPYSSSFIHDEPWLDFDSMQTWKGVELIYPMVTHDYNLKPVKPVLMAEGAYEHGSEYGFDVTPLWIRRQAYYSYLAGAHHTYGHNDSWRILPTWKEALDAPGATQLGLLKRIFQDRDEWWHLVPDQDVLASGGNTDGKVLNLAARHKDGRWIMVYLGSKADFSVKMDRLARGNAVKAFWVDPRSGDQVSIGSVSRTGVQSFSTPEGWEDALLILESSGG